MNKPMTSALVCQDTIYAQMTVDELWVFPSSQSNCFNPKCICINL